jgi:hypothetical protein
MKLWQDLVNCALFGTERRPWQAGSGSARVEGLLRGIAPESPADRLLHAAAVVSVYRRAGAPPARSTEPPLPVCPADTLPQLGPRAAGHLKAMFKGSHEELLPVALSAMAEGGQRLPEELLPAVLDLAQRRRDLRDAIAAVSGARGSWLAAHNPDWNWLNAADIPPVEEVQTVWETASMERRMGLVQQLRKTAPGQAIELIATTWGQEKADQRAQLLGGLRTGLTMADEPFLESRLDDKSLAVRRAAADLLADLPDSRLNSRMQARLQPLLRLESKGLLRRTEVLDLTLPAGGDAAMERDGIRAQAGGGQAGEKASLIAQMLAMVPPSVWTGVFSRSPNDLLEAAAAGDWKDLLWSAWVGAAKRHRDREWALALAQALPTESTLEQLLRILPERERDGLLCRAAENAEDSVLIAQVSRFPGPWSLLLTRIVLKRIRKAGERERTVLCRVALGALPHLDVQAASEISADWPPEMADLAAGLQFKHRLLQDIRNRC